MQRLEEEARSLLLKLATFGERAPPRDARFHLLVYTDTLPGADADAVRRHARAWASVDGADRRFSELDAGEVTSVKSLRAGAAATGLSMEVYVETPPPLAIERPPPPVAPMVV